MPRQARYRVTIALYASIPQSPGAFLLLGQHATPSAINAIPASRLTTTPTPPSSAPNNHWTTIRGYTTKTRPVATSTNAASARRSFILLSSPADSCTCCSVLPHHFNLSIPLKALCTESPQPESLAP